VRGAHRGTLFKWRAAGIAASWAYLFVARGDMPLVIAGRPISEREKLLGASGISVAVIFFLTSVGSVLFSAVCIGLAGACTAPVELRGRRATAGICCRCVRSSCGASPHARLRTRAQALPRTARCACRTTCSWTM
jgi:hypothetical protein